MHSNRYTVLYAAALTTVVAVILAVTAGSLRPLEEANVARAKRGAILQTVMEVNPDTLDEDYKTHISERVFDVKGNEVRDAQPFNIDVAKESRKAPSERLYPIYVYRDEWRTHYVIPLEGKGLWGPIRAYVALEADLDTIHGVVFDHAKETPGLGAQIATAAFQEQFKGKKLFRDDGTFESVRVLKGSGNDVEDRPHAVDGLTGATMTLNGVSRMLRNELALHVAIFEEIRP